MIVTLVGPDDQGCWFLHDEAGNNFCLVRDRIGYSASALIGWTASEDVTDEEVIIQEALDWMMEHFDDFEAQPQIEAIFRELHQHEDA